MRTKFFVSLLFTASTLFLSSHGNAGGQNKGNDKDHRVHPPVRQAPAKPNLSASEGLLPVQKPAVQLPLLSQSAPAIVQPWTNDWERAVFLYVHNTNQLQFYRGRIASRTSLETLKKMKLVLLEKPTSSLTVSQLGELTHLIVHGPFKRKTIEKDYYLKVIDFYVTNLQHGVTEDEEEAKFDAGRVVWHQKQLDAAHKEFEEANKVEGEAKPFSSQIIENWDKISRHLSMYFAFCEQTRELTEGLLVSAYEHFKKFVPQQPVPPQDCEGNGISGMEEGSQPGAPVAYAVPQFDPMLLESEKRLPSVSASPSSLVSKAASPEGRPTLASSVSGDSRLGSPAVIAARASQWQRPTPYPAVQPAAVKAGAASAASIEEGGEDDDGILVKPDAHSYLYPKTQAEACVDSVRRGVRKGISLAQDIANLVVSAVSS